MNLRALQTVNALMALLTIALAGMQVLWGVNSPVYAEVALPDSPILDSNLRFFGGMGLGLGLILLWITPSIARHTGLFRAVWLCAWLGGVGRLASLVVVGIPSTPLVAFTIIEVVGAPLLVVWQGRLARAALG